MKIKDTQKIVVIEFTANELIDIVNDVYKVEKIATDKINLDALLKFKKLINTIN